MTAKRVFDVVAASAALLVFWPVMAAIAAAVARSLGRPVFFRQSRPGLDEKTFTMYKFRTMRDAVGRDGKPLPDFQRLTPLGKLLRATSLDELPELFNVIKGDMSLVGPRPLVVSYLPFYTLRERIRHSVRPGITGWAQINGRNRVGWDDRLACDIWYVENQSFGLDTLILFRTVTAVLRRSNVEVDSQLNMRDLDDERRARGWKEMVAG